MRSKLLLFAVSLFGFLCVSSPALDTLHGYQVRTTRANIHVEGSIPDGLYTFGFHFTSDVFGSGNGYFSAQVLSGAVQGNPVIVSASESGAEGVNLYVNVSWPSGQDYGTSGGSSVIVRGDISQDGYLYEWNGGVPGISDSSRVLPDKIIDLYMFPDSSTTAGGLGRFATQIHSESQKHRHVFLKKNGAVVWDSGDLSGTPAQPLNANGERTVACANGDSWQWVLRQENGAETVLSSGTVSLSFTSDPEIPTYVAPVLTLNLPADGPPSPTPFPTATPPPPVPTPQPVVTGTASGSAEAGNVPTPAPTPRAPVTSGTGSMYGDLKAALDDALGGTPTLNSSPLPEDSTGDRGKIDAIPGSVDGLNEAVNQAQNGLSAAINNAWATLSTVHKGNLPTVTAINLGACNLGDQYPQNIELAPYMDTISLARVLLLWGLKFCFAYSMLRLFL